MLYLYDTIWNFPEEQMDIYGKIIFQVQRLSFSGSLF